jgi:hypothetical protein
MSHIEAAISVGFKDVNLKNNGIKKAGITGFFAPSAVPRAQRFGTFPNHFVLGTLISLAIGRSTIYFSQMDSMNFLDFCFLINLSAFMAIPLSEET